MSGTGANSKRIDMKHGFMKSIIQNQVARDNYDKEVKAKQSEKNKNIHKSNKPRKPDISVYVPPTKFKDGQNPLFQLEFENKDGEIFSTQIYPSDKGSYIANKIGQEMNLPAEFVAALEERIDEEIMVRLPLQET